MKDFVAVKGLIENRTSEQEIGLRVNDISRFESITKPGRYREAVKIHFYNHTSLPSIYVEVSEFKKVLQPLL